MMTCLNIGIAGHFHLGAGMGDGTSARRPNLVLVFPQGAAPKRRRLWLPLLCPAVELVLAQLDVERSLLGIEDDHVAVAEEPDRTADGGLGPNMSDAKSARGAGEAP